ncbi:MAG: transporter substrate-binding domain-containing protein [Oligoflexales bacterium]|nr:transporter substrate-binding domain-containing protein [Oligoflexales bacterium]
MRLPFFILMAFCLICGSAFSKNKTFTIGVEDIDYYPHYKSEKGVYSGYAEEVLTKFAKSRGYDFKYVPLPVTRLFRNFLTTQEVDFKYPDNPYWSAEMRKSKVYYSKSVVDYKEGVAVLPKNQGKGLTSLKKMGIVHGFTAFEYLDKIKAGEIKVEENDSFSGLLQQAVRERIDGAYSEVGVLNYFNKEVFKKPVLVFDDSLPHLQSSFFLSSIKYPEVIEEMNKFLVEEKKFVEEMKRKYSLTL